MFFFYNKYKLPKSHESEVAPATGEQPVGYASGSCCGATSADRKSLPRTLGPSKEFVMKTKQLYCDTLSALLVSDSKQIPTAIKIHGCRYYDTVKFRSFYSLLAYCWRVEEMWHFVTPTRTLK